MSSQSLSTITRVRYRERQVLRVEDLEAEQAYLIASRRRHNIGPHGWGIVNGLRIASQAGVLVVQPGMAIDGYGRELIIESPLELPDAAFDQLNSSSLDVFLFYDLSDFSIPQKGSFPCGPDQFTRRREISRLRLTPAQPLNPRAPIEVADGDLPFGAYRNPPDDPAREWPVYLGTITRNADPDYDSRPYATLSGESVTAPSGRARLQVGSELANDWRRFSVKTADAAGKLTERLAIDREGNTVVTADSTIGPRAGVDPPSSRLRMRDNRAIQRAAQPPAEPLCAPLPGSGTTTTVGAARMIHFLPLAKTPAAAAPWQVYRTDVEIEQQPPQVPPVKKTIKQLRLEIGHPGDKGDPTLFQLTVGTRDARGDFHPCLTVRADKTVIIEGKLNIHGRQIEGPIDANPNDPRFAGQLGAEWATGTAAGQIQTGDMFAGVNTGALQIAIRLKTVAGQTAALPNSITAVETLNYTFVVSNTGNTDITNVQLYTAVTFNQNTTRDRIPLLPITLRAGRSVEIDPAAPFDPHGVLGTIDISVTGIGVSTQPRVVGAAANASVSVIAAPA